MIKLKHDGSGEVFYATRLSAGFDLCANDSIDIQPGEWKLIPTGLKIIESLGYQKFQFGSFTAEGVPEIQIRPRSGLAAKFGITVLNSPSTIDADYRGEIHVNLINFGKETFKVNSGDRIAQGVCSIAFKVPGTPVKDVERGSSGFGSSGY
ncbi:MAG: dUTP diphosphatase [Silvanigrellaceae bacterium]|nr:dUTP diphosphatase [Silvanigrellaceae bacterium]